MSWSSGSWRRSGCQDGGALLVLEDVADCFLPAEVAGYKLGVGSLGEDEAGVDEALAWKRLLNSKARLQPSLVMRWATSWWRMSGAACLLSCRVVVRVRS